MVPNESRNKGQSQRGPTGPSSSAAPLPPPLSHCFVDGGKGAETEVERWHMAFHCQVVLEYPTGRPGTCWVTTRPGTKNTSCKFQV